MAPGKGKRLLEDPDPVPIPARRSRSSRSNSISDISDLVCIESPPNTPDSISIREEWLKRAREAATNLPRASTKRSTRKSRSNSYSDCIEAVVSMSGEKASEVIQRLNRRLSGASTAVSAHKEIGEAMDASSELKLGGVVVDGATEDSGDRGAEKDAHAEVKLEDILAAVTAGTQSTNEALSKQTATNLHTSKQISTLASSVSKFGENLTNMCKTVQNLETDFRVVQDSISRQADQMKDLERLVEKNRSAIMQINKKVDDHQEKIDQKLKAVETKQLASSVNTTAAKTNLQKANEVDLDRSRRSLKLFPCFGDDTDNGRQQSYEQFMREGMLFSQEQVEALKVDKIMRRGKHGAAAFTLEVAFEYRDDRDMILRCSSNLAVSNSDKDKDDKLRYKIIPIYPRHLNALRSELNEECRKIRDQGFFKSQLRYTDDARDLTIYVRAIDDQDKRAYWQERDDCIRNHGGEGFPEISKLKQSGQSQTVTTHSQ